jgi:hypothetical protein
VLVDVAESTGNAFGVTLAIRGMLVSGEVVSANEYYRGLTGNNDELVALLARVEPRSEDEAAERPQYVFVKNEQEMHGLTAEITRRRDTYDDDLTQYVHLRKVRFFLSGGNAPPLPTGEASGPSAYFRARLSSVDGFMAGRLDVGPPPTR